MKHSPVPARPRARIGAVAGALTLLALAIPAPAAQADETCRGSAARVAAPPLAAVEPTVANAAGAPCATDSAAVAGLAPVGPVEVEAPRAATRREAGIVAAGAGVAGANLTLGGLAVKVGVIDVTQTRTCTDGASVAGGSSRVDDLVIGGQAVPIVADRPVDLTVGPITVQANHVEGDTRRGVVLRAGDVEVVLAEATASGDACAALAGGGSGGGAGPGGGFSSPNGTSPCPEGSAYEVERGVCVIRTTDASGTERIITVGHPSSSPSGGRLMALDEARRQAASGKLPKSACLTGSGPQYVVLGTAGADRITGGNGPDRVLALGGADRVDGGRGADCLDGGTARDVLSGALGADRIYGGSGNDALNGGSDTDRLSGGTGNDTINTGFGRDTALGGSGNDAINAATAGAAAKRLDCGSGSDRLRANTNERKGIRGCERRSFIR